MGRRIAWILPAIVGAAALVVFALSMQKLFHIPEYQGVITRQDPRAYVVKDGSRQLNMALEQWTCTGISDMDGISFQGRGAKVYGVDENYSGLFPYALSQGRYFSRDELERGERKILLSENIAYQVDPSGQCVGREINIGGAAYMVIGIVRNTDPVYMGGSVEKAYIPLSSAETFEAYQIIGLPAAKAQSSQARMQAICDNAGLTDATVFSVAQTRANELLGVRAMLLLLLAAGIALLGYGCIRLFRLRYFHYTRLLVDRYAKEIWYWYAADVFLGLLAFLVFYRLGVFMIRQALIPISNNPKYVPTILIDISLIVESIKLYFADRAKGIALNPDFLVAVGLFAKAAASSLVLFLLSSVIAGMGLLHVRPRRSTYRN